MSITIKRFIPENAQVNRAFLIVGKKGSGKSTVMFTLLNYLSERVHYATAMCGTRDGLEKFGRVLPNDVIHSSFNDAIFKRIVQTLSKISLRPGYSRITAIILDDLAFGKGIFRSDEMRMALMNGRWLGLLFILTQQYLMDIGPDLRGNFDYIFAMAETAKKTRQKLYEMYFGIFNSFADFDRVFSEVTSKRGRALVLDTTSPSSLIQDRVFYFDGNPEIDNFVLGENSFRRHLASERRRLDNIMKAKPIEEKSSETLVIL